MRRAFTLIELLVVITIIVILLALLTPALDTAVYQAELTRCAGQQKAVGTRVITTAMERQRRYPYRHANDFPHQINRGGLAAGATGTVVDHRQEIALYTGPLNDALVDPFSMSVDLAGADEGDKVFSSFHLWFGWAYDGQKGMLRVGQRWTYASKAYRTLLQDLCMVNAPNHENVSHPDADGVMVESVKRHTLIGGQYYTWSWWENVTPSPVPGRGPVDLNVTYEDLATLRFGGIARFDNRADDHDERMDKVSNVRTNDPGAMGLVPRH